MNQHPLIFEQLENQHRTSQNKLELIQKLINQQNIQQYYICPHTVSLQDNQLEINTNQPTCDCINTQNLKDSLIKSILLLLFTFLEDDRNLTYYLKKPTSKDIIKNDSTIRIYFKNNEFNLNVFDNFKINLQQYQVFENINDPEAKMLISLKSFAIKNNFENQISFSIQTFPQCHLKLVNLLNGKISNTIQFDYIQDGFIKLLQFFLRASENNDFKLKPVCIHTVNLGNKYAVENVQKQYIQTSQQQCQEICGRQEICQSFGNLLQNILKNDFISERIYSDVATRIVSGQINSLKLIIEFLDQNYIDNVELIDLRTLNYQPFRRRIINDINTHIEVEIDQYKIYFIRKTMSILANLLLHSVSNNTVYSFCLKLLNIIENIYYTNSIHFLEQYQKSEYRHLLKEQIEQIQQERINFNNLQISLETKQEQLNLLSNHQNIIEESLISPYKFQELELRIFWCLHCDFFFQRQHMIQNMTQYLQFTQYSTGIQFKEFEQFLEDQNNYSSISQMLDEYKKMIFLQQE